LLAFCSLPQIRAKTAAAIIKASPPVESQRLTTPVLGVCRTALLSFDEALVANVPLKAARLLHHVIKVSKLY
jgi:hypothetical protein